VTLFLASVYHTGTRFCRESLFSDFSFGPHTIGEHPQATQIHIELAHIEPLQHWLNTAEHIVVPLRHPMLVAGSWKARGLDLVALDEQWRVFADVVMPSDPIYLPLDHPDRGLYLEILNQRMGLDLKTDWRPVGSRLPKDIRNDEPLTSDERHSAECWSCLLEDVYGKVEVAINCDKHGAES